MTGLEKEQPRIGYVGLDHHHTTPYLRTLEELPVTVSAVCGPGEEVELDSRDGLPDVTVYRDLDSMFSEGDLDAVFLTLSNRDTPNVIEKALRAEIDIFTEKPAARTAEELRRLRTVRDRSDATVCVSYPWSAHPVTEELKQRVENGFFGEIQGFEARFFASQLAYRDTDHFLYDADASRGGILQWLGIHWIQLLSYVLPSSIASVNCRTIANADGVDVEDGATVQVETEDGAIGTVNCGYYLRDGVYDTQINLYGTSGHSRWDPMGGSFGFDEETTLKLDSMSEEWASTPHRRITYEYDPVPGYGGSWGLEFIEGFFDACDDGVEPPVTLEDAIAVLEVLDAAYESAKTDGWITVERD